MCLIPGSLGRDTRGQEGTGVKMEGPSLNVSAAMSQSPVLDMLKGGEAVGEGDRQTWDRYLTYRWTSGGTEYSLLILPGMPGPAPTSPNPLYKGQTGSPYPCFI